MCVVQCGLSDHFPICITLGFDKVKCGPINHHESSLKQTIVLKTANMTCAATSSKYQCLLLVMELSRNQLL